MFNLLDTIEIVVMRTEILSEEQHKAARYAKAMGNPVRMYVLELLSNHAFAYSGDISEGLPISKSTFAQHLNELKDSGLIESEIIGKRVKYYLNEPNWKEAKLLFRKILKMYKV